MLSKEFCFYTKIKPQSGRIKETAITHSWCEKSWADPVPRYTRTSGWLTLGKADGMYF